MKYFLKIHTLLILFLIVNIIINNHIKADGKDKKVKISDFPAKDLPDKFEKSKYANGDSYKYYYGIGKEKDYVKARYAAFIELEHYGDDKDFGGSTILMMLYANGLEVTRNIDLALKLAKYNVKGTIPDIEGRIETLKKLKIQKQQKYFDYCDFLTGGGRIFTCAIRDSDIENQNFDSTIYGIIEKWDKNAKKEFLSFRSKIMEYIDYKSETETSKGGTLENTLKIEERQRLRKFFYNSIVSFESGKTLKNKVKSCAKAEKELNKTYTKLVKNSHSISEYKSLIGFDLRHAQYKWFEYREAWTSFVISRYPKISKESVCDWITKERIKELKEFNVDNYTQDEGRDQDD